MTQSVHKFLIRIRMDLFERVRESSAFNHRSLNAEINFRLEHSLNQAIELGANDFVATNPTDASRS